MDEYTVLKTDRGIGLWNI